MSEYLFTGFGIAIALSYAIYLYCSRYKITLLGDGRIHIQNTKQGHNGCPHINMKKFMESFPDSNDLVWVIEDLQDQAYRDWLEIEWKRTFGVKANILFVDCDDVPGDGSITVIMINDGYAMKAGGLIHFKGLKG